MTVTITSKFGVWLGTLLPLKNFEVMVAVTEFEELPNDGKKRYDAWFTGRQ